MPILIDKNDIDKLKRRRRSRRIRPVKSPAASERELAQRIKKLWDRVLNPASERIRQMVRDHEGPARIAEFMEQILRQAEFEFGFETDDMVGKWMLSVDQRTRAGMLAGLKSSLGVDVKALYDDPVIKDALAIGGQEAAGLIKTIPGQFLGEVARAVSDNFQGVELPEGRSLLEQIMHIGGVSRRRAVIISRDQSGKLASLLNMTRMQSIGIDTYIWATLHDNRVTGKPGGKWPTPSKLHGNHYRMDGLLCKWSDPSVYSDDGGKTWKNRTGDMPKTNVGIDILCRCFPKPVFNIDEVIKHVQAF